MTEAQTLLQECRQRQDDEIVALQSIYAPLDQHDKDLDSVQARFTVLTNSDAPVVELYLPVQLPRPVRIVVNSHWSRSTPAAAPPPRSSQSSLKSSLSADASAFSPNVMNGRSRTTSQYKHLAVHDNLSLRPSRHPKSDTKANEQLQKEEDVTMKRETKTTVMPLSSHLSPITIRLQLPSTYPAREPPFIEDLQAAWLPYRDSESARWIEKELLSLYKDMGGLEILWTWATWLSEGLWTDSLTQPLDTLGAPPFLHSTGPDKELQICFDEHVASEKDSRLPSQLLAHSRLCTRTTFDSSSFDCGICLETKKGKTCTKLVGCGHVFCSDCLTSYLSMLVEEGFHRQAHRCPDPECVRMWGEKEKHGEVDQYAVGAAAQTAVNDDLALSPLYGLISRSELECVLNPAQLQRLESLTIKARMEADPSLSYCPREGCQAAVVRSSSDEGSGHWERFRECHKCSFAFCAWCSRSWHGPTTCPVSFQAGIIKQYLALEPESPAYLHMQKKFGKKTLDNMVKNYLDEQETKQWLQEFTTPCPTCGISIEKSYGCNHMTCKSCLTHYCYLCGKTISGTNPYSHFNTAGYDCYNRLFDGLLGPQNPQGAAGLPVGPDGLPFNADDLIPWEELV